MPDKAVIAYVFDRPNDINAMRMVTAVSKQLFEKANGTGDTNPLLAGVTNLRVHAAVGDAANTIDFFTANGELPMDVPEESNWVAHARRELELLGQTKEDPEFAESIIQAVRGFASYGHSGGSMGAGVHMLFDLLQFKNLSPLTDDPEEWMRIAEEMAGSPNLWQSRRNPEAFSTDGGKTYYLVSDTEKTTHTSVTKDG